MVTGDSSGRDAAGVYAPVAGGLFAFLLVSRPARAYLFTCRRHRRPGGPSSDAVTLVSSLPYLCLGRLLLL